MSLWEYKALYKQVKQAAGTVNDALIYQAWEDMQSLVETSEKTLKRFVDKNSVEKLILSLKKCISL